jgi:hypothetical protein
MPQLPSGIYFALAGVLSGESNDLNFSALREHILANAKDPSDLYGLLEVVRFAPEEQAASFPRVDFQIPGSSDVAYLSGGSFLSFLNSLSTADQEEAIRWISTRERQSWLIEMILEHRRRSRAAGLIPALYTLQTGFLLEPIPTYKPPHFALRTRAMFGSSSEDLESYQSDTGCLRIRPTVLPGIIGLQGTLALGNPPRPDDIDAWEGSKSAGVWDYWAFLNFTTVPDCKGGMNLVFHFSENTFFERPNEVVATLPWTCSNEEDVLDSMSHSTLITQWESILNILSEHDFLGDLERQQWTVQGVVYDCFSPDE